MTASEADRPSDNALASVDGRYPISSMICWTFARVASLTSGLSLSTLETVPTPTPATRATSWMVANIPPEGSCALEGVPGAPRQPTDAVFQVSDRVPERPVRTLGGELTRGYLGRPPLDDGHHEAMGDASRNRSAPGPQVPSC